MILFQSRQQFQLANRTRQITLEELRLIFDWAEYAESITLTKSVLSLYSRELKMESRSDLRRSIAWVVQPTSSEEDNFQIFTFAASIACLACRAA